MAKRKPDPEDDGYDKFREDMAEKSRERSQIRRDIGAIPIIADVRRRARCRKSLRAFCQTYNPKMFHLPFSAGHLNAIAKLEETVLHGALYAFAMPRGGGKTSLERMAALWALSYAMVRYVFIVGANSSKANENLDAIKSAIRFLPLYVADFPEIATPAVHLGGIANRASGQLCEGESTLIEWSADHIALPTVNPPANWPKGWELRSDGKVPTSGSAIAASGLTGDGIRGSLLTLSTGEAIRPDLVLLDDPQTDESAKSPSQCDAREELIAGAVLGMAGPDKPLSAFLACTIISPGDMAERLLDRSKHPLWRGERTALLSSMPSNMDAVNAYMDCYRDCVQQDPPDLATAAAYWRAHRAELEEGAVATWPARKLETDVSAVQYAINLLCRSPRAFWSEYQNQPLIDEDQRRTLTAAEIAAKANGVARLLVPSWATRLTAFVDVQGSLLFYAVTAWREDFTGHVVDYGTFPDQRRAYFTLRDARPTLADATGAAGMEAQIFRGLTAVWTQLLSRPWQREDGTEIRIERGLVDSGWQTELVYQWVRQCGRPEITASKGIYAGPTRSPLSAWKVKPGERKGLHWVLQKALALYDPNRWKSFAMERLATEEPMPGCLTLHADPQGRHALLCDHLTSERPSEVTGPHGTFDVWECLPNRDNHWLDCVVGCAVAASIQGVTLQEMPGRPPGRRVSFRKMYDAAHAQRPTSEDGARPAPAPPAEAPSGKPSWRELYDRAHGRPDGSPPQT